ncbi:hypothetical protein BH09PSE4_BH09PSE4_13850 [soil metagenome]
MSVAMTGHGLSAREQQIMDLHEAGNTPRMIAGELGLSPRYVRLVMSRYSGSWAANTAFDDMVRRGSIAMGRALAATGKRYE